MRVCMSRGPLERNGISTRKKMTISPQTHGSLKDLIQAGEDITRLRLFDCSLSVPYIRISTYMRLISQLVDMGVVGVNFADQLTMASPRHPLVGCSLTILQKTSIRLSIASLLS